MVIDTQYTDIEDTYNKYPTVSYGMYSNTKSICL